MGGRTLLSWRATWDTAKDAREFQDAFAATLGTRGQARPDQRGFRVIAAPPWTVAWRADAEGAITLLSSDDARVLEGAMGARGTVAP